MARIEETTGGEVTRRRALGLAAAVAFGAAAVAPNFALARELEPGDDHGGGGHGADDPPGDDHGGLDDSGDTDDLDDSGDSDDADDDSGHGSGSSGNSGSSGSGRGRGRGRGHGRGRGGRS